MTVSVCVGTFGDYDYWLKLAEQAFESVRMQTVPVDLCHSHIYDSDQRNCGPARNEAVAKSSSEWILFLDADDTLAPDCVEHLLAASGDVRVPAVQCQRVDGMWSPVRPLPKRPMLDGAWPVIGSLMRRKDFLRLGGFRPRVWGEDSELWLRAELSGLTFGQAEKAVYRIGYRPNSRKSYRERNGLWLQMRREAVEEFRGCKRVA